MGAGLETGLDDKERGGTLKKTPPSATKPTVTSHPKLLVLDVETRPALVYTFRGRKAYIAPVQIVEPDGIITWSAKWYGKAGVKYGAGWDDDQFLKPLVKMIEEADAVITFNGDGFDIKKIRGELVKRGMFPLAPVTSIDLYKTVTKLGYFSGKLEYVAPLLKLGRKLKHTGFELWKEAITGNKVAQGLMKRYNKQDVRLTEELYATLRPHITKHPNFGPSGSCATCGSSHVTRRGYRYSDCYVTERVQCQDCGHWGTRKRTKK